MLHRWQTWQRQQEPWLMRRSLMLSYGAHIHVFQITCLLLEAILLKFMSCMI